MTARRRLAAALAVLTALVLSACAGLPTSGSVNPGLDLSEQIVAPNFSRIPDRPQAGATPLEIVNGFLRAGSGPGASLDWVTARLFLAPEIRSEWDPTASVTIDTQDKRTPTEPSQGTVKLVVQQEGRVDATGAYAPGGGEATLNFKLAKQEDGEWRITEAPDGIVLDSGSFATVYDRYPLMFFDPSWQFLVPDLRWFPRPNPETSIAAALVEGPSPWLATAVESAFPQGMALAPSTVPLSSNVADVSLSSDARGLDSLTLDRMQTQLTASLSAAGVTEVRMSTGGIPLPGEILPTRSTAVATSPLALTDENFGFLGGNTIDTIQGLSAAIMKMPTAPVSVQVAPNRDFAAVRLGTGDVARVEAQGDVVPLDDREGLIDPVVDPFGYVWSVPRDAPAELAAFDEEGDRLDFTGTWTDATQVSAMALSRDGTRLATILTRGGRHYVYVVGIMRDVEGVPAGVSAKPLFIGGAGTGGIGIAWLDGATVGVLAMQGENTVMIEQPVGGPASAQRRAPDDANSIAGANQTTAVRLHGPDGQLYLLRGSSWPQEAEGVRVLATQQGAPPQ